VADAALADRKIKKKEREKGETGNIAAERTFVAEFY
jgi:hypothetical protein